MQNTALEGGFAEAPQQSAEGFRAAMEAMEAGVRKRG